MNRRNLLRGASALMMAGAAPAQAASRMAGLAAALPRRLRPRVRPGDPGWPTAADWAALKTRVGGALVKPTLPMAACADAADKAVCAAELKNLRNPFYLGDQPGGTQVSGWLDAWVPAASAYAVAARNAADVAAAVDFARLHNLRLVVKGGGHSYQGTSNAPDSLLVWTRAMKAVTLHDAFTPEGCEGMAPTPAVTVEAGAMWIDAYDAVTTKAGRYVQGGGCTTVGVAGHIQSGGFGSFSKRFGLAAASLLQAEVVTADGRIRTVNARRDPELFWALKGGGGGSFGVVTKVTLRTHELPERFGGLGGKVKASSDDAYRRLIARFVAFYAEALCNPHWGEQAAVRPDNVLEISMVNQGLDMAQAHAVWKPFLAWIAERPEDYSWTEKFGLGTMKARDWWSLAARTGSGQSMIPDDRPGAPATHAWWRGDQDQVSAFLHGYESVWLPASLLAPAEQPRLAEALYAASRQFQVGLHFNKGLAGAPPEARAAARDAATNPAAVDAFALAIIATGGFPPLPGIPGPPQDMAAAHRNAAAIDRATAELWKVVRRPGSYVSESNYFNPRWADAFWGDHYPRLKAAKAKYDPAGLFTVHHGVGSDAWSADGFRPV